MPSRYWIKLNHRTLDDSKMGKLPDRLWRRAVELSLIAGECNKSGVIPSIKDIAQRMNIAEYELEQDISLLDELGIIATNDYGEMYIIGFEADQATSKYTKSKRESYRRYLQSDHWKETRAAALDNANNQCQKCGNRSDLQVHHLNYENMWHENQSDLIVLCKECHREEHGLG